MTEIRTVLGCMGKFVDLLLGLVYFLVVLWWTVYLQNILLCSILISFLATHKRSVKKSDEIKRCCFGEK